MQSRDLSGRLDASGLDIAVVVSEFNAPVGEGLLAGALDALEDAGATGVTVVRVPGAFELPLAAQRVIASGADAVVALGAVILGETDHYEHVAHRASEGLMRVSLDTGVPVAFGILTTRNADHALARSRPGDDNKGAEAARAVVRAAQLLREMG